MKIKRTFKPISLKRGTVEYIDEEKMEEIAGQTSLAQHEKGECGTSDFCGYCSIPAIRKIEAGIKLETYFSTFELVSAVSK